MGGALRGGQDKGELVVEGKEEFGALQTSEDGGSSESVWNRSCGFREKAAGRVRRPSFPPGARPP
jgi:hypothetical protein